MCDLIPYALARRPPKLLSKIEYRKISIFTHSFAIEYRTTAATKQREKKFQRRDKERNRWPNGVFISGTIQFDRHRIGIINDLRIVANCTQRRRR